MAANEGVRGLASLRGNDSIRAAAAYAPPRSTLRLAVIMAALFVIAAGGIFWYFLHFATTRAEHDAEAHARFVTRSLLVERLRPEDLERPVSPARAAELDAFFRRDILVDGALRAKLYSRDGVVTYSTEHSLIGAKAEDEPEEIAASGKTHGDVSHLNEEGGSGRNRKVLETYVPVRLHAGGPPAGVFELYQDYGPVAHSARSAFYPLAGVFALCMLLLYAALFPIVRRTSAAFAAQDRELRESDAKLRALVEHVPLVTYMDAPDGTTAYIAPQIESLLGYPVEEWLRNPDFFTELLHSDDRERVLTEVTHSRETGEPFQAEYRMIGRDGKPVWVLDGTVLVRDETGTPLFRHGFFLDVTAEREAETENDRLEAELRQAQKMEGIGRLAGGVAHDFNNLLLAIGGYCDIALGRVDGGDPELRAAIEEIKRAGERAAGLTRQLLAFSRKQILQPKVVDLNEVVAGMDAMLRRLIGEDIDVATELSPGAGVVKADPGQLEQVIVNLVVNARDAMPAGGKLTIETAGVNVEGRALSRELSPLQPGSYAMLAVSDTGVGIDAAARERIFDPFFTTKEQGKGTGLGLSTVYGIVKQSGGSIFVYSEPGHGTTFKIYLPQTGELQAPSLEDGSQPGGAETILLVEDDDVVRGLVSRMLVSYGYDVVTAADPEAALELSAQRREKIDLLVTDVVMPKMSGRDLAMRLCVERPETKILYISGYTDRAIVHHGVLAQGTVFLQKPFTAEDLARKVRTVLDEAPAHAAAASG